MLHASRRLRPTLLAAAFASTLGLLSLVEAREPGPARPVRPETRRVPQAQWEYKAVFECALDEHSGDLQETFNRLGEDGWELVGLASANGRGAAGCLLATFKRPMLF